MVADWQNAGFGVYIHWPFCAAKCPYCDFNSHVRQSIDQTEWATALCDEIRTTAAQFPNRTVSSIFFGGGTPSLMDPRTVSAILDTLAAVWTISDTCEITLEANPTSVEATRFQAYAASGVNRISMGIQALNDTDLKALGRMHTTLEAQQAFDIARKTYDRVSFDLIYARQNQTLSDWESELTKALSMAVDHLSLYQLTIEEGTRFGDLHARKRLRGLPSDTLAADLYDLTQDICTAHDMPAYEVSNHAAVGHECKHNLIYWRYGDYAGIGPGAHGRMTQNGQRIATDTPLNPENWLKTQQSAGTAIRIAEHIAPEDQAAEYAMMSLRLSEGCNLNRLDALSPNRLNPSALTTHINDGYLEKSNLTLKTTPAGRLVLNALLRELLVLEN